MSHENDPQSWNHRLDPPEQIDTQPECNACGRVDVALTDTPVGLYCAEHAMTPSVLHARVKELEASNDILRAANNDKHDRISDLESSVFVLNAEIGNIIKHLKQFPNVAGAPESSPVVAVPPQPAPATPPKPEWVNGRCDYGNGVTGTVFDLHWSPPDRPHYGVTLKLWGKAVNEAVYIQEEAQSACDAFIAAVRWENRS